MAFDYASAKKPSMLFRVEQGMADRGADLSWISMYPHEKEICFPPCTGLEVQRKPGSDEQGGAEGGEPAIAWTHYAGQAVKGILPWTMSSGP